LSIGLFGCAKRLLQTFALPIELLVCRLRLGILANGKLENASSEIQIALVMLLCFVLIFL